MTSIIEHLRSEAVGSLFKTKTVRKCWPIWEASIKSKVTPLDGRKVLDLGDDLSSILFTTRTSDRGQSSVSGAGTAWESLIAWYMNLCLIGTRVVVIKQSKNLIPEPIRSALQVNYSNFPSNTESDLLVIVFPDNKVYSEDISSLKEMKLVSQDLEIMRKGRFNHKIVMDHLLSKHIKDFEIGIIQSKTNWNDNAQIPMLWDMVYSSEGFRGRNITIGHGGYSIRDLKAFTYAFVTVPTVKGKFKGTSAAVRRVQNISGGNYWGKASMSGVASSIKEIFTRNYRNGISGNLVNNLNTELERLDSNYSYFFPKF